MLSGWLSLTALLSITLTPRAIGQSKPAFDVASVKPGGRFIPGIGETFRGGPGSDDPGRIVYTQVHLTDVIQRAYGVNGYQVSGPAWLDDASSGAANIYTINATMPEDTTAEQFQLMLRNLVAERFHLAVHRETRDFPGYELFVAPGGPKLKEAIDPAPSESARPSGPPALDANGHPILRPGSTSGPAMGRRGRIRSNNRMTMADFIKGLVQCRPQTTLAKANSTCFTALEKQPGLRLVKNVPVDIIVVDQVDQIPIEK